MKFIHLGSKIFRSSINLPYVDEIPKNKNFTSNALWPTDSVITTPVSTDKHHTEQQAAAVCRLLELEGYGGIGIIFPIKTWVGRLKTYKVKDVLY